jgi:hypothetical protein
MKSLGLTAAGICLALVSTSPLFGQTKPPAAPAAKPAAPAAKPPAVDPDSVQALKEMSAYLSTLKTVALTSNASLDVVTKEGQRVQLDGVVRYKIRRPDGFVISMVSSEKERTFYYNGKTFTVYAPKLGFYASAPAPKTIRETLDTLSTKFGIQLPLEDLFRWNDPSDNPAAKLSSSFYVGTAMIDGVLTDHYAFRQPEVDWEIWIQQGPQALPRKVVIVDRKDPANPTYIARLSWVVSAPVSAADFTFHPTKTAKLIRLSELGQ